MSADLGRPERNDHPWVAQAYDDVETFDTIFRLRYRLPPTDPRYLDATDEDLVRDALLHHFVRHREEYERDPVAYELRELAQDPKTAEDMEARRKALVENPLWHRMVHRLRDGVTAEDVPVQNKRLTVRTKMDLGQPKQKRP